MIHVSTVAVQLPEIQTYFGSRISHCFNHGQIFQRSLLGDSYLPPQFALLTWQGPDVGHGAMAEGGEELAAEAREDMNETLLEFTISLDFTTPLQIPKLHVSKQTTPQPRPREVNSIAEEVMHTPPMLDGDRARTRTRRTGKQRCVCVGLEGPSSW
jgi:hypothetical protein